MRKEARWLAQGECIQLPGHLHRAHGSVHAASPKAYYAPHMHPMHDAHLAHLLVAP